MRKCHSLPNISTNHWRSVAPPPPPPPPAKKKKLDQLNSFLTDDDSTSFSGQCRSGPDCTESAV